MLGASFLALALPQQWRGLGRPGGFVVFLAVPIGFVRKFVDIEKFDRRAGRYRYERDAETQQ